MTNSELCAWLHQSLETLPEVWYPFNAQALPLNGIYFFYEKGECCGHGEFKPRIVRVGTHREGNFRSRIAEHFLLDEQRMIFTQDQPTPHERSIFRKHIGRALLNKAGDPYLSVWNLDFTTPAARAANRHLRDINKEVTIEREVTRTLRENFCFKVIEIEGEAQRMGSEGLERALIGTVAKCPECKSSKKWLGHYSPVSKIKDTGVWLVQHLRAAPLSSSQQELVRVAIQRGGI